MRKCRSCEFLNPAGVAQCQNCGGDLAAADPGDWRARVRALLDEGKKIEAIKEYRQATGAGLAEAKDAVERREFDRPEPAPPGIDLETRVLDLLRDNQKIAAIKLYRENTGKGLKESKEAVEALGRRHGVATGSGCAGVVLLAAAIAFSLAWWIA